MRKKHKHTNSEAVLTKVKEENTDVVLPAVKLVLKCHLKVVIWLKNSLKDLFF